MTCFSWSKTMPRTVRSILLLLAAGIMLLAVGCFWNDDKSSSTPTPTASATTIASTPTQTASGNSLPNGNAPSFKTSAFRDNRQFVKCESTFADQTGWLLCEPGVLLDNTATFTRGQVKAIYNMDCPEGGFAYASFAQGRFHLARAGFTVDFPNMGPGTNRLIAVRCPLSDGKRDSDLNDTIEIGNFVVGHTIWSEIPPNHPDGSAFVSKGWFGQQLVTSFHTGGSNCGSDGCSTIYVTLIDVNSQLVETFKVTNITFKKGPSGYNDYVTGTWERVSSNK